MKKTILALLILIPGLLLQAQSLVLSDSSGQLAPDAVVTLTRDVTAYEIISPLSVTNASSDTLFVACKKVEISLVTGSVNMFCWTQCYGPGTYVTPDPMKMNPGFTDHFSFYGEYYANGNTGTSRIAYVFYDQNNPDDSVRVFIDYVTETVGIDDLFDQGVYALSRPYPNPASTLTTIDYNLPENAASVISIHNLLGSKVASYPVSGSSGQIVLDVSTWNAGLYFYTLTVNKEVILTRKMMVSR